MGHPAGCFAWIVIMFFIFVVIIAFALKVFHHFLNHFYGIAAIYILMAIIASSQSYVLVNKPEPDQKTGITPTKYNNYVVFRYAHLHQVQGKNLYTSHPQDHWDLYKYSPSFATFFGVFAWLPDWAGLTLWNLLNVLVFLLALFYLPVLDMKAKVLILLGASVEALTSMQNSQSNLLMAGLIICGFNLFERKRVWLATLCIMLTFFIKLFGIIAFLLLIFYPEKRKIMLSAAAWFLLLLLLPLPITGFWHLLDSYRQYFLLLQEDQSVSYGISVMGMINTWTGLAVAKNLMVLSGLLIMCAPLLVKKYAEFRFRIWFLASMLLWMVLYNHKAESPTFIIAISGVMLWFFSQPVKWVNLVLLILVLIFSSFSPTDLFPSVIREGFIEPYAIKALPCFLVWIKIIYDSFMLNGVKIKISYS